MTGHSYSSPAAPGQVPLDASRRGLLRSTLLWLGTGGLLLASLGLWPSLALGLGPAAAAQALLFYGALSLLVLLGLPQHLPLGRFGPANAITLLRGVATCWLAGLVGQTLQEGLAWPAALVAGTVLLLDAFDGWVARRGGWTSAFGARFDLECDAFFLAVLSLLAVEQGGLGPWILLAGALRYLFVAAGQWQPWLQGPLAPRWRRKAAYAVAAGLLVAVLVPGMPSALASSAGVAALALLVASFLADVMALHQAANRTAEGERP